jgi:putative flippase GtrA
MSDMPAFPRWIRQFSAFVGVGALATALDYAVFFVALWFLGVPAVPAALIGYAAGGALSYALNRAHVFETARAHHVAILRFMSVMVVGFIITGYAMRVFTEGLELAPLLARLLTYGVVLIFNFIAHRFFTFR